MSDNTPQYLHKKKSVISWNWWGENPVEIILVVFIVVFFFALPRTGCGVSEQQVELPPSGMVQR